MSEPKRAWPAWLAGLATVGEDRTWRRRVSAIALVLLVATLGTGMCKNESASAEIRFRVGDAGAELRQLEAELLLPEGGEVVAFYRGNHEQGSGSEAGRWPLRVDPGLYQVKVALVTPSRTVRVERAVEIREGAVVTLDLEPDLARR